MLRDSTFRGGVGLLYLSTQAATAAKTSPSAVAWSMTGWFAGDRASQRFRQPLRIVGPQRLTTGEIAFASAAGQSTSAELMRGGCISCAAAPERTMPSSPAVISARRKFATLKTDPRGTRLERPAAQFGPPN